MEKRASRRSFYGFTFLVLPLVLILGVLPFSARAQTYSLAELTDTDSTIQVGSLTFSNFSFWSLPQAIQADPEGIFLDIVGQDGPQPGLKIRANNQLSVQGALVVTQASQISYNVTDANGSIQGSSVLLVPSCVASGSKSAVGVTKNIYIDSEPGPAFSLQVFRDVFPDKVEEQLLTEEDFSSSPQASLNIETNIIIQALPNGGGNELGQAALCGIEQRFKVAETRADAGLDQVVQDSVLLDGSGSEGNGLIYAWRLIPRDPSLEDIIPEPRINPIFEVKGLAKGLYDVTLSVTDENDLVDTDTMLLAAAGACEDQGGSLPPANDKLHLWNFKLKKYKFCNWAFARVYGTVDASDFPLENYKDEDGLKAKVILQVVDKDGNTLGEYSDETAVEFKNRRYKYVIRKKY